MALFTEWCPELVAALAEPFPKNLHENKGSKGTFVSVHHYVARLNALVGPQGWAMPEPSSYHAGNKLGLCVGITVLGVTKWNVGDEMEDHGEPDEDGKVRDFGSSSTNSFAQAFKRCCAYGFGLGLYLYDKELTKQYLNGRAPTSSRPTDKPPEQKRNGAPELPTESQLATIARISKSHLFTDEEREGISFTLEKQHTKAKASEIIDWLVAQASGRKKKEAVG